MNPQLVDRVREKTNYQIFLVAIRVFFSSFLAALLLPSLTILGFSPKTIGPFIAISILIGAISMFVALPAVVRISSFLGQDQKGDNPNTMSGQGYLFRCLLRDLAKGRAKSS